MVPTSGMPSGGPITRTPGAGLPRSRRPVGRIHRRPVCVEQIRRVRVRPRAHHEVAELLGLDRELLAGAGVLAHALVREEEERAVAPDRPAEAAAEVVLVEIGFLRVVQRLEVGLRAHVVVAVEREAAAAQLVRAAAGHEADRRARVAAELGRRVVGDDLELLDRLGVRHDEDACPTTARR